jgi:putative colanic acid biosynthesis UDP-glucose lipid carrier transferase
VAGHALHDLAQGYDERHQMKPGITGWAQVNGCRGEVDEARKLRRRVALDCYYIENWSLAIDISILFRTAALLFVDRHAY